MHAMNGTASAPATALDVIEARETDTPTSPLDAYLEQTQAETRRIAGELEVLRDQEQRLCDELTRRAGEARARAMNYSRAIAALKLEPTQPKAKAKTAPKAKPPGGSRYEISDAKVAEIERRVRELAPNAPMNKHEVRTMTAAWVANQTPGLSPEAVAKGFHVLREREVVRIAGKVRGGGTAFALMPEGDSGE